MLAIAAITLAPQASAAVVTYTSSAAFLAAVSGEITETYEDNVAGSTIATGGTLDGITYVFSNARGAIGRVANNYNAFGVNSLALTGAPVDFFDPSANESATVSFGAPVNAFGIFFNAGLSPAGSFFINTGGGDTATSSASYDTPTFYFVGITSDTPFSSVTFGGTATATTGFNVDDLSYAFASAVPEPASIGLAGLALLALAAARRSRRAR